MVRSKQGVVLAFAPSQCALYIEPVEMTAREYILTLHSITEDAPEYTGGSVSYYSVDIEYPTSEGVEPYTAECNDIIEALGHELRRGKRLQGPAAHVCCPYRQGQEGPHRWPVRLRKGSLLRHPPCRAAQEREMILPTVDQLHKLFMLKATTDCIFVMSPASLQHALTSPRGGYLGDFVGRIANEVKSWNRLHGSCYRHEIIRCENSVQ
jgi:hypothetical protein